MFLSIVSCNDAIEIEQPGRYCPDSRSSWLPRRSCRRLQLRLQVRHIIVAVMVALSASPGSAATLLGEAQKMGKGTLRTYVDLDSGGAPSAVRNEAYEQP